MNDPRPIATETVEAVDKPPRARVSDIAPPPEVAPEPAAPAPRQRDYLDGFLAATPPEPDPIAPGGELQAAVVAALKEIYDPEIPVNIYDLGLIYDVIVGEGGHVTIRMTLTTPHCPVAESMPAEVELRAGAVPGVGLVDVELVWDPPWNPSAMSDEARLELGML